MVSRKTSAYLSIEREERVAEAPPWLPSWYKSFSLSPRSVACSASEEVHRFRILFQPTLVAKRIGGEVQFLCCILAILRHRRLGCCNIVAHPSSECTWDINPSPGQIFSRRSKYRDCTAPSRRRRRRAPDSKQRDINSTESKRDYTRPRLSSVYPSMRRAGHCNDKN